MSGILRPKRSKPPIRKRRAGKAPAKVKRKAVQRKSARVVEVENIHQTQRPERREAYREARRVADEYAPPEKCRPKHRSEGSYGVPNFLRPAPLLIAKGVSALMVVWGVIKAEQQADLTTGLQLLIGAALIVGWGLWGLYQRHIGRRKTQVALALPPGSTPADVRAILKKMSPRELLSSSQSNAAIERLVEIHCTKG